MNQNVGPSPSTKKSFLQLSVWDDKLSPTPNIITFLAESFLKLHEPALSDVIPQPLYT